MRSSECSPERGIHETCGGTEASVMRSVCLRLAGLILAVWSSAAFCADTRWFFRAGPTGLLFDSSARIKLGGRDLAGASLTPSDNATRILEGGYVVTPDVAVVVSGGVPPTTTFTGTGTIAGLGTLGK